MTSPISNPPTAPLQNSQPTTANSQQRKKNLAHRIIQTEESPLPTLILPFLPLDKDSYDKKLPLRSKPYIIETVRTNGLSLYNCHARFQSDIDIVETAVLQNPLAIFFASRSIQIRTQELIKRILHIEDRNIQNLQCKNSHSELEKKLLESIEDWKQVLFSKQIPPPFFIDSPLEPLWIASLEEALASSIPPASKTPNGLSYRKIPEISPMSLPEEKLSCIPIEPFFEIQQTILPPNSLTVLEPTISSANEIRNSAPEGGGF